MIDISKISGFGKTPGVVSSFREYKQICKMAGMSAVINQPMKDARAVKKLLDDRRELLEVLIDIIVSMFEDTEIIFPKREKAKKLVKQITGKSWEEL
jgi:hypothetical protein